MPWLGKKASARSTKPVTVAARLVAVELDVGQARVVVDDRVGEVVADPGLGAHPAALRCERSPVTGVSGPLKRE